MRKRWVNNCLIGLSVIISTAILFYLCKFLYFVLSVTVKILNNY